MSTIKNKKINETVEYTDIDEFVNFDGSIISGDRNTVDNSEIETGPVQKPWNDTSDYEKGVSTTTDRALLYRQNIPWFAVYSYGGSSGRGNRLTEKKETDKEITEVLVKKSSRNKDILDKNYDNKLEKVIDIINDTDLAKEQLEKIKTAVLNKIKSKDA